MPAKTAKPVAGTCRLILQINETPYVLTRLRPDPQAARAAWRLRKVETRTRRDGTPFESEPAVYDVAVLADGLPSCDCPDAVYRRANTEHYCKHARALRAAGLLEF